MVLRRLILFFAAGAVLLSGPPTHHGWNVMSCAWAAEETHGDSHTGGGESGHQGGGKGKGYKQFKGGGKGHAGHGSGDDGHKGSSSHAGGAKTLEAVVMNAEEGESGNKTQQSTESKP